MTKKDESCGTGGSSNPNSGRRSPPLWWWRTALLALALTELSTWTVLPWYVRRASCCRACLSTDEGNTDLPPSSPSSTSAGGRCPSLCPEDGGGGRWRWPWRRRGSSGVGTCTLPTCVPVNFPTPPDATGGGGGGKKRRRRRRRRAGGDDAARADYHDACKSVDECCDLVRYWRSLASLLFGLACLFDAVVAACLASWERRRRIDEERLLLSRSASDFDSSCKLSKSPSSSSLDLWWDGIDVGLTFTSVLVPRLLLLPVNLFQFAASTLASTSTSTSTSSVALSRYSYPYLQLVSFVEWYNTSPRSASTQAKIDSATRLVAKFVFRQAARNPLLFYYRVRTLLDLIRTAQFAAPILSALSRLRTNLVELWRRHRQRVRAKMQARVVRVMYRRMSVRDVVHEAVVRIQAAYRSSRDRRMVRERALRERRDGAASTVQAAVRRYLARDEVDWMRKGARLAKLVEQLRLMEAGEAAAAGAGSSEAARELREMARLREELRRRDEMRLSRLALLRPNSRFALAWKGLFIVCILLELSRSALAPWLVGRREKARLDELLGAALLPSDSTSSSSDCGGGAAGTSSSSSEASGVRLLVPYEVYTHGRYATIAAACASSPSSRSLSNTTATTTTAFAFAIDLASWKIYVLTRFINFVVWFVSAVVFFDVIVKFFEGGYDDVTGTLEPKPFVRRWILPGVLYQMLMNPAMARVYAGLKTVLYWIHVVGPGRVARWSAAVMASPTWEVGRARAGELERGAVRRLNRHTVATTDVAVTL